MKITFVRKNRHLKIIMSEPPEKKSKPNQCDLIKITDDKIKWYTDHLPAERWRQFTKIRRSTTVVDS